MKRLSAYWLFLFLAGWLISACSSSEDTASNAPTKSIREHEKTFNPSDYRKKPVQRTEKNFPKEIVPSKPEPVWVERTEKTMGYRVQLFSTTSLDEATSSIANTRYHLDSLRIDPGRLDMSFDAPYYKVRAGDFLVKISADSLREQLKAAGINEAWVVRDNVFRVIREMKQ